MMLLVLNGLLKLYTLYITHNLITHTYATFYLYKACWGYNSASAYVFPFYDSYNNLLDHIYNCWLYNYIFVLW